MAACCYPQSKYAGWDDHVVTSVRGANISAVRVYPYQVSCTFLRPSVILETAHASIVHPPDVALFQ